MNLILEKAVRLENKVALITGASSGIGEATARSFARLGASLILCARRTERLEALATELKNQYQSLVHIISLDVTAPHHVEMALTNLPVEFINIDIVVNNAGLAIGLDPLADASIEDWDKMIDTNIKGLLYVTKAILPDMLVRKTGHIVNIGSISGHQVYAKGAVYCATKHAVKAISRALKLECQGSPIRVTEVDPGLVETEFSMVRFKGDTARAKKVYENIQPLTAQDVADAICYAVTRPAHVNVAEITLGATEQPMQLV
ncbi:MAG: short-chain alcohol dehydrogenase [Gammaproteobacteria bacterium]|jgi:NADP-dependent 3-hydroxy acid dehydrogenase YdfG|nr:short-chain alcohol dehydrogenase [Gammaproteobacteria bacterium]